MDDTGTLPIGRRIRAGDADRQRVVALLTDHHAAGRLTVDEFTERMDAALAARWLDELGPLLTDLPGGAESAPGAPRADRDGRGAGRGYPPPWRDGGPPFVPLLAVLASAAVAGSVALVAHGHFPFPLLWLGGLLWFAARRRRAPDRP